SYLFPNGCCDRGARRTLGGGHYPIPPTDEFAFSRSPDYNRGYYNPDLNYQPWVSSGSTNFTDVTPTATPYDPIADVATRTIDLTVDVPAATAWDEQFAVLPGMINNVGAVSTTAVYEGFTYFPATYFLADPTLTLSLSGINQDCAVLDVNRYENYRTALRTGTVTGTADSVGPDGQCLTRVEIRPTTLTYASGRTYVDELQNFANWFTYYRKRHQAMRGGMTAAFDAIDGVRVGTFRINNRSNVTMRSLTTDRVAVLDDIFNSRGSGGTPLRESLDWLGQQFERTDSSAPITQACQKNYGIAFTDGFANASSTGVGNADGSAGAPYQDTWSNTMGDIAWEYYENFNAPTSFATGLVPAPAACSNVVVDQTLDCNEDLHMTTYGVTLNSRGTVFGVTHTTAADAHNNPPVWPEPNLARNPRMVDDLYHAAINGRGEMLNARTPLEIATRMATVLETVIETEGTAAAVTFNTGLLSSDSLVYQAKLDSEDWSGFLTASTLDPITGDVSATPAWDAADRLPTPANRQIVTSDPAADGIPFRNFAALTVDQQNDLTAALPATLSGQDMVDYLRGDRSNESETLFRERSPRTVLGDIVHSGPVLVAEPRSDWPNEAPFPTGTNSYGTWSQSTTLQNRRDAVYVGGNDGMLHGIWADTGQGNSGEEFFAYIPEHRFDSTVGAGLHALGDQNYTHQYFVDLTPVVADVRIPVSSPGTPAWRTILVGGMRGGSRALFALDVTNPTVMTEANAADVVLWEFTSDDDPDLGFTFSDPTIALMNNGRWAAVFGNGFNNTGTTEGVLFILYLDGGLDGVWTLGSDYEKIYVPGANNGLSTPQLADLDRNGTPDRAYAGDLQGNLWAFELDNANPNQWGVAYGSLANPEPLAIAYDNSGVRQAITSKPVLARCPFDNSVSPDIMVLFGTGQYVTEGDKLTTQTQTFYGIWDRGVDTIERVDLLEQFANDPSVNVDTMLVRVPTQLELDPLTEFGWYMDLPDVGERVVSNPLVRGDLLFFNTIIPDAGDPCVIGGGGWLMSVKICSGGRPDEPAFDLNRDFVVTNGDTAADTSLTDANGNPITYPPGGERFDPTEGLPWQSSVLGDRQYTPGSTGSIETRAINVGSAILDGRLSWEQIINE
ncbi:MAG: PilC/PilY family type IV pilus protein, partial [Pseudomonadota bacterium]